MGEAIVASSFEPTYSYARNYISDLGVSDCGMISEGRVICSPLHNMMNVNFVLHGLLFFIGTVLFTRALKSRIKYLFPAFAGIHLAGNVLIAVFHGAAPLGDVSGQFHLIGAVLAILSGNLATLSAPLAKQVALPVSVRIASKVLPLFGFCGVIFLAFAEASGASVVFPKGVWERVSVDAIMLWEIVIGLWLITTRSST